ncbi:hypothetical protein ES703_122591 [subsurface metagenome]
MIDRIGIVRRDDKGCYPLSPQLRLAFVLPGKYVFLSFFARDTEVCSVEMPVETSRINDIRIRGIDGVTAAFTARCSLKIHRRDLISTLREVDIASVAAMILHRAIDAKRRIHIVGDIKKLAHGQVMEKLPPGFALVVGDHDTAIVDVDNVIGIIRIDPQPVMIAVHAAQPAECLSAIIGHI